MHESFADRLTDYLDGDLEPEARAALEAHLASCDACRSTLAELRAVVARAAMLKDTGPDADLWPAVAERIASQGKPLLPFRQPHRKFSFTFSFTLPQLAAAVLAIFVLSAGMIWMARLGGDRTDFPPVGADERTAEITPANFADEPYDRAIEDLQQTLAEGRKQLDPETVRVLEDNLKAIDHAIEQCRSALASDPANVYLNSHLADAKRRKLALLRRASALAQTEG